AGAPEAGATPPPPGQEEQKPDIEEAEVEILDEEEKK
nr:hypothetical protein [Chlamydiota bacterium]